MAAIEEILAGKGDIEQPLRIQETPSWDPVILYKGPTEKENLL